MGTSNWRAVVPPREEDEEDVTDKQLLFIEKLLSEIGNESINFDLSSLGKWQASAFIDQLIDIRDNGPNALTKGLEHGNQEKRKVSTLLGIGILVFPYIFAWFLLRRGYSTTSRIIAFSWGATILLAKATGKL